MTDNHLKEKLQQYIRQLYHYQRILEQKKKSNPKIKDKIMLVIDKADLEVSYLEDQLVELEQKQLSTQRVKHKISVIMKNYSKILDEINKVLDIEPIIHSKDTKKEKNILKESKLKQFAEELNSGWMFELLNRQKQKKIRPNSQKTAIKQQKSNQKQKGLKQVAIQHLQFEAECLLKMTQGMRINLSIHKHSKLSDEVQCLREQERQLLKAVLDIKQSNELLRTEFQKLQKQLNHLRKNRQIL